MWFKYGLKAQKLLAQGIALGIMAISKAPCKGKSFQIPGNIQSFCPSIENLPFIFCLHVSKRCISIFKR